MKKKTILIILAAFILTGCKRRVCYNCYDVTYNNWAIENKDYKDKFCRTEDPNSIYHNNGWNVSGVENGTVYQCFKK